VGRGGVHELLTRLDDYRRARNPGRLASGTQLILTGHSFGGLVMYSALSHSLVERGVNVERYRGADSCRAPVGHHQPSPPVDGRPCYTTANSVGDLVVLVNPAFEGSLYEQVFNVAANRCYPPWQRPVLMTVTSAGDEATGTAFPLGRTLNTLFERSAARPGQLESVTAAVGHDPRYETHKLNWVGAEPPPSAPGAKHGASACGCDDLEPTERFNWWAFVNRLNLELPPGDGADRQPSGRPVTARIENGARVYDVYGPDVRLLGDPRYPANFPYLVVKTDASVIRDHNAIYSEPFIRFLHSFFLQHIATRRPFEADACFAPTPVCRPGGSVPCEESCRTPDGNSCTGRDTEGVSPPR
jgi:hypothetical protein